MLRVKIALAVKINFGKFKTNIYVSKNVNIFEILESYFSISGCFVENERI